MGWELAQNRKVLREEKGKHALIFGKQAALAAPISACTDINSLAINDSQR